MTTENLPWYKKDDSKEFLTAEKVIYAALSKKAENIVVLDLRGNSDIADFFVVMTATTNVHVSAVSRSITNKLVKFGEKPIYKEGEDTQNWVLIDYFDIVVHVMQPKTREYYNLEKLWGDVQRLDVPEDYFENQEVRDRHPELFNADEVETE
ncbi:ribosome silencing factor [bacterium]|jgi:ribosome-associated protein|nr:ribosome silencing factor [bacterium]